MFDKDTEGTAAYAFAGKYRAAYGAEPDIYGALAYDLMGMIAEAADGQLPTRAAFRDRLAQVSDYAGAMGTLSFDANREVALPVGMAVIEDGALTPVACR